MSVASSHGSALDRALIALSPRLGSFVDIELVRV